MKSNFRWGMTFAGLAFALASVARAPISVLGFLLPQSVQFQNVEGSLWNGSASAIGIDGTSIQEHVEWRFQPQSLLSATLRWDVSGRFGDKLSHLSATVHPDGMELKQLDVFFPLEPLASLYPSLKAVRPGAELHATSSRLRLNSPSQVSLDVNDLYFPLLAQAGPLGSYRVTFDLNGNEVGAWKVESLTGNLSVVGQGQIRIQDLKASGRLMLLPRSPIPSLSSLLKQLPQSGDAYLLAF